MIVSKSGNTIETIVNSNILVKKKDKNIFITENKKNYLYLLGQKLKADIIELPQWFWMRVAMGLALKEKPENTLKYLFPIGKNKNKATLRNDYN